MAVRYECDVCGKDVEPVLYREPHALFHCVDRNVYVTVVLRGVVEYKDGKANTCIDLCADCKTEALRRIALNPLFQSMEESDRV